MPNRRIFRPHEVSCIPHELPILLLHEGLPVHHVRYLRSLPNRLFPVSHGSRCNIRQDAHPPHYPRSHRSDGSDLWLKHFLYTFRVFFLPLPVPPGSRYFPHHMYSFSPFFLYPFSVSICMTDIEKHHI
ncbi:Uncharacterised protein [Dorea longicatena]|nr:Uncharacterised protein [Dorea longicatena]